MLSQLIVIERRAPACRGSFFQRINMMRAITRFLLLLACLVPLTALSQYHLDMVLPQGLSEPVTGSMQGALGEQLMGPYHLTFSTPEPAPLPEEETTPDDKPTLTILYSGTITSSPALTEPFSFTKKTIDELQAMQIDIHPAHPLHPYTLQLELSVHIMPASHAPAGTYYTQLQVHLSQ